MKDPFIFLASGRLLIWTVQNLGLLKPLWKRHPLLAELNSCDFCLGTWVFLVLLALAKPNKLSLGIWPAWVEKPVLAVFSSFVMHLLRIGWNDRFGEIVIE